MGFLKFGICLMSLIPFAHSCLLLRMENKPEYLVNKIKGRYLVNAFYKQSTVLFVYWLLKKKKQRLMRDWPLPGSTLALLASDLGISLDGD